MTPPPAMYSGSDHAMSAALALLQPVPGFSVGVVARSVWTQAPTSPELLIRRYGAPAGGVTMAWAAISSMPSMLPFQLGVAEEAFRVSTMPPPCTCRMWSRLDGSISTSSTQPEAVSPGIVASISRQVWPPSSDSCTICWPLQLPQELVTPSAMRVVAPVPETDRPPRPGFVHCVGSTLLSRVQVVPSNL